jgi:hypothetical protein
MEWKATHLVFILQCPKDKICNGNFVFIKRLVIIIKVFKVEIFVKFRKTVHRKL